MEKTKSIDRYFDILSRFFENVRTEVIAADLLYCELDDTDLFSRFSGQHKRPYSRDLGGVNTEVFHNREEKLIFHLNRDSLYDALPETLFHQPHRKQSTVTSDTMAKEYRARKKEEQQARDFFSPVDHELFFNRVESELFERSLLFDISNYRFSSQIAEFFGIDAALPQNLQRKLYCILPVARYFKGNIAQVAKVISIMTGYPVQYTIRRDKANNSDAARLGNTWLGNNLTLYSQSTDAEVKITFHIGPVNTEEIPEYLPRHVLDRLMNVLFDHLIPLEYTPDYRIISRENETPFILDNFNMATAILAYTTVL